MNVVSNEGLAARPTSVVNSKRGYLRSLLALLKLNTSIEDIFRRTFHAFIGVVTKVDVKESRLLVKIPNFERELWANYPPSLEKFFLSNQGNLVEFEGKIKLDKTEVPYSVKSIDNARLADDSNIRVSEVLPVFLCVKTLPKQFFDVYLTDDKQTYVAEYEEISFSCWAHTRTELKEAITAHIELDWTSYAKAPDETFHSSGIALKEKLRSMFEEK